MQQPDRHHKVLIWTDTPEAHQFLLRDYPQLEFDITTERSVFEERVPEADIVYLGRRHNRSFLNKAQKLSWLHVAATGVDQLGDLASLSHIQISNMPGLNAKMMADYCLCMMMMLTWNMPLLLSQQQQGQWHHQRSQRLEGKRLLILGLGNVGRALVPRARAAGLQIVALRRRASSMPGVERIFPPEGLFEALAQADYVICTLPATPETRGLLDLEAFKQMQEHAYLINVGRGDVIVESALVKALEQELIAGAALDVVSQEPLPEKHQLWQTKNLIITPHVSGFSKDYRERAAQTFASNLERFLSGQPLHNVVNRSKGY